MSWHCLICGGSKNCNGLIEVYHIGGGIPTRSTIHLRCLAKAIEDAGGSRDICREWICNEIENEKRELLLEEYRNKSPPAKEPFGTRIQLMKKESEQQ